MKTFYIITIALFSFLNAHSQSSFGFTAGYVNGNAKVISFGEKDTESKSGFYAGVVLDNKITEVISVLAELSYMNVDKTSFLQLPLLAKVYIAKSSFNVQGGLQVTYTLEDVYNDFTKFNIGLGGGFGYDITDKLFVEARYIFQLNNYFNGPSNVLESRINFFNIGLGYKI